MYSFLLLLNTFICIYFVFFSFKNLRVSPILCLSLILFTVMYSIGFIVILAFPSVFVEGYLLPDYNWTYAFPLPINNTSLYALTYVNFALFLGLILTRLINIQPDKRLENIVFVDNKNSIFLGIFLSLLIILYFCIFFYMDPTWPIIDLLKTYDNPSEVTLSWFEHRYHNFFLFYPSVMRQFLQILMPLGIFYLLGACSINKNSSIFLLSIVLLCLFSFLIIGLLKTTPILIACLEFCVFILIQKSINKKLLFFPILFALIGFYSNYFIKHYYASPPKNITSSISVTFEEDKEVSRFKEECAAFFKSSKLKMDFSEDVPQKLLEYNKEKYISPKRWTLEGRVLGRLLTGEMMDTFMVVGNEELTTYYRTHEPFIGYLKKIVGLNQTTIYQALGKILTGELQAGSISISFFYELFLLLGNLSIIPISFFIVCLSVLDHLIFRKNDFTSRASNIMIDPTFIFLLIIIAQMTLKGFIVSFFTGGFFTILGWLGLKTLYTLFTKNKPSS